MDKKNLILLPTTPRKDRLAERAKIVAHNFHDEDHGIMLIDFMLVSIYNTFKDDEDFYSDQLCAKVLEARTYLQFYGGEDEKE